MNPLSAHFIPSRFAILTLGLALCCHSFVMAQEPVPADRRLPPGVLAYLSIPDASVLKEKFLQTGFGQLVKDDAMDPFWAQFAEKLDAATGDVEEATGATLPELLQLVAGEFSLAFVRTPEKGMGGVGFVEVGDQEELLTSLLDKLGPQLTDQGATRTNSSYSGTEMTIFKFPSERPNPKQPVLAYFIRDGIFVVGSNAGILEQVCDRWDGNHEKTFAGDANYQYVLQQCCAQESSAPVIQWYSTPVDMVLAGMSYSPELAMPAAMATGMLPTLGLNKFKAYGGSLHLATEQHDYISRAVMCIDPPTNGLLNVFQFPATIKEPPAWVPADVMQYVGLHWDLQLAYSAVIKLVDAYLGPGSAERSVQQMADDPSGPGLHIKTDVIDQLTGIVHFYSAIGEGEMPVPLMAASIGVNDDAAAEGVLKKALESMGEGAFETEEVAGVTAYIIANGNTNIALAAGQGQFVAATGVDLLESVLTGQASPAPLAKSDIFQKCAESFPEAASWLSFTNFSQGITKGYEAIRSGNLDALAEGEIDFSILPPFESISKYLQPQGSYMMPTDRGAIGVQFMPRYAQ